MKIGVIGLGVVGGALYEALTLYHKQKDDNKIIYGYDIDPFKSLDEWKEIIKCDWVFICVPTDSGNDGRLKMGNVATVLSWLKSCDFKGVCVIKSTLKLGWIEKQRVLFNVIVFPEWLYEANPIQTTINPEMTVVGYLPCYNDLTSDLLNKVCPWHKDKKPIYCYPEEAVMIKLTANALAATKISFANQIKMICDQYGIPASVIMKAVKTDPRCSPRYLDPGRPFGGYCLPKDTKELASCSGKASLFNAVIAINEWIKDGITKRAN